MSNFQRYCTATTQNPQFSPKLSIPSGITLSPSASFRSRRNFGVSSASEALSSPAGGSDRSYFSGLLCEDENSVLAFFHHDLGCISTDFINEAALTTHKPFSNTLSLRHVTTSRSKILTILI
jgi:hypothetical protein